MGATRYSTVVLCLIALLLGFALMVQCAMVVISGLVVSDENHGPVVRFGLAGLAPIGAALAAWLIGAQELDRNARVLRTAVVTLIAEVVLLSWLAAHGIPLTMHWI